MVVCAKYLVPRTARKTQQVFSDGIGHFWRPNVREGRISLRRAPSDPQSKHQMESNTLGAPDDKLGAILMSNCLRLLGQRQDLPEFIILLNGGVLLATKGM